MVSWKRRPFLCISVYHLNLTLFSFLSRIFVCLLQYRMTDFYWTELWMNFMYLCLFPGSQKMKKCSCFVKLLYHGYSFPTKYFGNWNTLNIAHITNCFLVIPTWNNKRASQIACEFAVKSKELFESLYLEVCEIVLELLVSKTNQSGITSKPKARRRNLFLYNLEFFWCLLYRCRPRVYASFIKDWAYFSSKGQHFLKIMEQ